MVRYDFTVAEQMADPFVEYAKRIPNADRIRLAAFLLGLVNAVQQHADMDADDLFHARETTTLFDDVEQGDSMDPGYHLHNMLENLASEFDELADTLEENGHEDPADAARAAALSKLTDAEKVLLGLPV